MPRPVGSKNKAHGKSVAAMKMLQARFGEDFDPLARMAEQAIALADRADETDNRQDRDSAINALEKVTKYVRPQLKAQEIDLSSSDGSMTPPRKIKLVAVYEHPDGSETPLDGDEPVHDPEPSDEANVAENGIQEL